VNPVVVADHVIAATSYTAIAQRPGIPNIADAGRKGHEVFAV
jgi:hypothetical protein